ncbi:MAG: hypothetical protein M1812_006918 [Candelaria pacifica]|nr:MAG: hypothetical protein M1812_006918 [Candelaria pacifica]
MAVKVIAKASNALKEAGGSVSEYQEVLQYLNGLLLTLQHLQNLNIQPTNPAILNAIRAQCASSEQPILEFVGNIQEFEKALGVQSSKNAISGSHKKVQWGLFVTKRVEQLRNKIGANLEMIHLLLESYNTESIQQLYTEHITLQSTLSGLAEQHYQSLQQSISAVKNTRVIHAPRSSGPGPEPRTRRPRTKRRTATVTNRTQYRDERLDQAEGKLRHLQDKPSPNTLTRRDYSRNWKDTMPEPNSSSVSDKLPDKASYHMTHLKYRY